MTVNEVKALLAFIELNFGILPDKTWQRETVQRIRDYSNTCWVYIPQRHDRILVEKNSRNVYTFKTEEEYNQAIRWKQEERARIVHEQLEKEIQEERRKERMNDKHHLKLRDDGFNYSPKKRWEK
jgi:hypothetical protein